MKKQPLGMEYQDKYGLAGTKPSDYVIDENGNVNGLMMISSWMKMMT